MINLLQLILCVLMQIPYFIIWGVTTAVNAAIVILGAAMEALAAVLPDFPTLPSTPSEFTTISSWVAWFFPVSTVVSIITWFAVVWLAWWVISIVLRWAKAKDA